MARMKTYYARIPGTQLFIRVPRRLYNCWPWCGVVQMPNRVWNTYEQLKKEGK